MGRWSWLWIFSAAALVTSCTAHKGGTSGGASSSGPAGSSSSGTSAGVSQGTGSSGGSSSAGASTSAGSSNGSSTGALPSPYVDGGYVFCSAALADGGTRRWMCQPGTYFCDPGASATCSQCRGDSDCADPSLPTNDPRRPRCDLDSGVPGFQGFCQQCIIDSDCPNEIGLTHCDLSPTFPANAAQPPIVTLGFEACGPLETDCRRLDGPVCRALRERCNAENGRCEAFPKPCASDQDCIGRFDASHLREPFCVNGACQACDGGPCPYASNCDSDSDCGNPYSLATGLQCDRQYETCMCTDSSQCGSYWPICVGLDGGRTSSGGQAEGTCGCDDATQCGDGGLSCLLNSFCGVPCYSPEAWGCGTSSCDFSTGVCVECTTNADCEGSFGTSGPDCIPRPNERVPVCLCVTDGDCSFGYACEDLVCVPVLPHCSPSTCDGSFCNWMTGVCAQSTDPTIPRCLEDYDCAPGGHCKTGTCYACFQNSDCTALGPSDATLCCHDDPVCSRQNRLESTCAPFCHTDSDCKGNTSGPSCSVDGGLYFTCGCGSDADCASSPSGSHCVTNPSSSYAGTCACESAAQCPAGDACEIPPSGDQSYGQCTAYCYQNLSCQAGFACDSDYRCRPRCDQGFTCAAPDLICDIANVVGQNGLFGGDFGPADAGAAKWCYQCFDSRDCGDRLGCVDNACAPCADAGDCRAGTTCASDGLCHSDCDDGWCDGGQLCDVDNRAGEGNVCFDCRSPADCPDGEGCDSRTHTCGTCEGVTDARIPGDCPPDGICSTYWIGGTGVCLQNCDRDACPPSAPICGVFPALTPDHAYCFGCREDGDCADGGRCDTSVHRTFQCLPESTP